MISVRATDRVEHVRVIKGKGGYQIGALGGFATVSELVRFYRVTSLGEVCGSGSMCATRDAPHVFSRLCFEAFHFETGAATVS